MIRLTYVALSSLALVAEVLPAQDSSYAAMQSRGATAMGVDQYTSVHRFDDLANGGRIRLERSRSDTAGAHAIQRHLNDIARAFATGDFSTPAFVHMRDVPGTAEMTLRRASIAYHVRPLPRGAELTLRTSDPIALHAIHEFLAFQRGEHHSAGHDMSQMTGAKKP